MRKYCKTKQHSVKGARITSYIIEDEKCKDWIQRAKPDEIAPKTKEELEREKRKEEREKAVDDYL